MSRSRCEGKEEEGVVVIGGLFGIRSSLELEVGIITQEEESCISGG